MTKPQHGPKEFPDFRYLQRTKMIKDTIDVFYLYFKDALDVFCDPLMDTVDNFKEQLTLNRHKLIILHGEDPAGVPVLREKTTHRSSVRPVRYISSLYQSV